MKLVINFNSTALEGDCYKDAVVYTKGDLKNLKQGDLGFVWSGAPLPNGSTPLAFVSSTGHLIKNFSSRYIDQKVDIRVYFNGNLQKVRGMFDE